MHILIRNCKFMIKTQHLTPNLPLAITAPLAALHLYASRIYLALAILPSISTFNEIHRICMRCTCDAARPSINSMPLHLQLHG
jgi:hypothetical protein